MTHALVPFREAVSSAAEEIDLASRVGETNAGYSCGTAPDSHRLRLGPCREFGLSDAIRCSKSRDRNQRVFLNAMLTEQSALPCHVPPTPDTIESPDVLTRVTS